MREIATTFLGVALLLSLIVLSMTFIRIMSGVVEGTYTASSVLPLLLLKTSSNLIFVFPLMFFLSVLLALGRLYRDSEMTALNACAFGPDRVQRTVGQMALLVALLFAALSLFYLPWAYEQDAQLKEKARSQSQIEGLAAGRFNALGDSLRIYLESIASDRSEMYEVFAYGETNGRPQLLSAARAQLQTIDGERYMVFYDGYRYEGEVGQPAFRIMQFREHGLRMRQREVAPTERPRQAMSTWALLNSPLPVHAAEWQWRLVVPISALLFGLLAVPLARSSPREGRYARLVEAMLIYIVYSQLIFTAKSSVAKGALSPWLGLWWVHALALALLIFLLWRQQRLPAPRRARAGL